MAGSRISITGTAQGFSGADYDAGTVDDRQWNDAAYSQARVAAGYSQPDVPGATAQNVPGNASQGPQPAYPGGPVPEEYQYADDENYGG